MTYYSDMLQKGEEFQKHVQAVLFDKYALALDFTKGDPQNYIGETLQGIEVKYDMMFEKSGNLWIEIAEKTDPKNPNYVNSGIMRDDNSWLFIIGDYKKLFVFTIKDLRMEVHSHEIRENNMKTSMGYLLPEDEADLLACLII